MENIFFDIGLIIIIATTFGYFARLLRQPLIPAYVLAGVIMGPYGFSWINDIEEIKIVSEIGIAFLLFVVGLELDLTKLKDISVVATVGSSITITVLFISGFVAAHTLGIFTGIEAIYVGMILAFSSTMVVIKLLVDKNELETLHGRIIIGILLVEDVFAILSLSIISNLGQFSGLELAIAVVKGLFILFATLYASRYIFPPVFKIAAESKEILFLLSITICFAFAFLSDALGFSIAIGAFVAGVALANLPYNIEISARIKPLRDFFSTLFFGSLGLGLVLSNFSSMLVPLIVLFLIIVVLKPLIIMFISSAFGYSKRTSFLTAISLIQISEFALIIVSTGSLLGHVSSELRSLTIFLAIATIVMTTYIIKWDNQIYKFCTPLLRTFDKLNLNRKKMEYMPEKTKFDVILIGYDRIGYTISKTVKKINRNILVVDYNPDLIKKLMNEKIPCFYGDIGDPEIIDHIDFKDAEIIISTAPDKTDNLLLINKVKKINHQAAIFVTSSHVDDALSLYEAGADYVILPHFLGGHHVSLLLEDITMDLKKILDTKIKHIEELHDRKKLGHHTTESKNGKDRS